ncbi:5-keto-2-deoxygluconokinase [Candidatus Rhodobacter oscarellae]|uniref:5-keto-2-deoxygluconokinase n=1 Tax=Candidatus Rhodobacter oscarellae TaxID=1675527 RepID=A0A0J9GX46_9RHOB|nr:5-dehydro-2-deoxygluconokinase [Candidatus Rhodobacter lobularis]KMW58098.1 5-keto-2-deoxygluconokinase [Candidatus Rhodobacter lobularis]
MTENKGILVIGRAGMDFYADPPGTRLEDGARFTSALGGSSANIAAGVCRQGGRAALVTSVSDDPVGSYCINQLAHFGVDTAYVRRQGGEARNSLAVVDTNGADTQSVIYRNNAADFQMTEADIARVDFTAYDTLVTTGTVLAAEPSRSATFAAFERARAAGLTIVFDLDYRPYSWPDAATSARVYAQMAEACDIIIGNDDEFGVLAQSYADGLAAARGLAASGKTVVYKMGHRGSVTFSEGEETRQGVFQVDALKPTGAGDAFMAGFLMTRARGGTVPEAVRRGSATAAIVVTRVGCAPAMPTTAELDRFLASHPGPSEPQE